MLCCLHKFSIDIDSIDTSKEQNTRRDMKTKSPSHKI